RPGQLQRHVRLHAGRVAARRCRMSGLTVPLITSELGMLGAALEYAQAGWYITPARRCTKDPGSVLGKGWQTRPSRDPEVIVSWYAGTDHGIALHAGRSGAIVLDID